MRGHLRLASPWRQLGVLFGFFCLTYVFIMSLTLIVYSVSGISTSGLDLNNSREIGIAKFLQALASIILFILPVYIFARFTFTGNYGYFLGFRKAERSNMYVLGVVAILLAMPFVFWLGDLNSHIPLPNDLVKLEEASSKQMAAFLKVNSPLDIII